MAADALLALAHHNPDDASPEARVGALLVAEFLGGFRALILGLSKKK